MFISTYMEYHIMMTRVRNIAIVNHSRINTLLKLLPLVILVLAIAGAVVADGMPGGGACPGC